MRSFRFSTVCLVAVGLASCSSTEARGPAVPLHVAMAPVFVQAIESGLESEERAATAVRLAFDGPALSRSLAKSLDGSFVRVTALSDAATGNDEAWLDEARVAGADVILDLTLTYDPAVYTELNDRFWLNLPLFALGGPLSWFVADRSYFFQARLEAEVFDLTAAASPRVRELGEDSRLVGVSPSAEEASLSFLGRATGAESYLFSLVIPSGFLASESDGVAAELQAAIAEDLGAVLARNLRERRSDLLSELVDFHPEEVRIETSDDGRHLVGSFVLRLGRANELGPLRYRVGEGAFATAPWGEVSLEELGREARAYKRYPFRIAVGESAETVQLEVEQLDADGSRRTFTFAVSEAVRR